MTVYLVGAGPGDPRLITARGLELLRSCDAVVHDRLVSRQLVAEAPAGASKICRDGLTQQHVDALLVELGRQELEVVRLKGGDPYVFGRGGEEALALTKAGIPFEVVPGVSSLAAVPAAAGIPLTHRGLSERITIVTGHSAAGDELDYASLAPTPGTLVILMGLAHAGSIADGLIEAGKPPHTPAAVIGNGTLPEQQSRVGPLAELARLASSVNPPALIVIGDVVALASQLGGHNLERAA